MSLAERLFGRSGGARLDLVAVQARLAEAVRRAGETDPDLTRARFADGCRDAGLAPPLPEEFDAAAAGFDPEAWRRLAVLVSVFALPPFRAALPQLPGARSPAGLAAAFAGLARDTPLLTAEVLGQSELRVEELARRLAAAVGAGVAGESAEASRKRLDGLDYGRLLAEAERAKSAAADRAERLRKLREEQEQRRTHRGKW
jgi:hypothetical protein